MPVVMMSGHGTIETAVEATRIGAFDFLEKPIGLAKLLGTIARALKTAAAREPRRVSLAALGTSAPVREAERALETLLAARRPVLILGEPGTGHDVAAQALRSRRTRRGSRSPTARGSPPIRCSLIEEAHEGTLYCAEIGQYSKAEQKGLAFLLGEARAPRGHARRDRRRSRSATLAAEGKFDAALLSRAVGRRGAAAAARAPGARTSRR